MGEAKNIYFTCLKKSRVQQSFVINLPIQKPEIYHVFKNHFLSGHSKVAKQASSRASWRKQKSERSLARLRSLHEFGRRQRVGGLLPRHKKSAGNRRCPREHYRHHGSLRSDMSG